MFSTNENATPKEKFWAFIKLVAIFAAAILIANLITVAVSSVVDRADAYDACGVETPCNHPKAARQQSSEYYDGRLRRTNTAAWDKVFSDNFKKRAKRAYRRYTEKYPYGPPSGSSVTVNGRMVNGWYDWPSPKQWYRKFTSAVGCAFVGTTSRATSLYCSSGHNDMVNETQRMSREVRNVTIKCGGDFILGGFAGNQDGAKAAARQLGVKLSGGVGAAAIGGKCLWNNYYDRFWWVPR